MDAASLFSLNLTIIIAFVVRGISSSSSSIYEDLFNYVQSHSGSSHYPPIFDAGRPFMVSIQMGLGDVSHVDRDNNQVEISLMAALTWNSSVVWDPSDYHDIRLIPVSRNLVWYPEIAILNAATKCDDHSTRETTLMANGLAVTIHHYRLKIFCDLSDGGNSNSDAHDQIISNSNTCVVSAVISTHGNTLIHLQDPLISNAANFEPFFKLSRHEASAYPIKDSRMVKTIYQQHGLPGKKERVDLEFTFGDPHRHHRHSQGNVFLWH